MVAAEFGRLRERVRFLERELEELHSNPDALRVDDETMTRVLGEETVRVFDDRPRERPGNPREGGAGRRSDAERRAYRCRPRPGGG